MCGLIYYKSFNDVPVNERVIARYELQKARGRRGFGFYLPQLNQLTHNVREERILELLRAKPASEVLYHHRLPTSTENVRNACHPFSTHKFFRHNYVMIHNGVICNDIDLSIAHQARGIHYVSGQEDGRFNDSEALLYDLALYLEGEQSDIKAKGRIAFIVIERNGHNKPSKLHFGRNSLSPLFLSYSRDQISLASQATTTNKATEIMPDMLYTYTYRTGELSLRPLVIPEPDVYPLTYAGNTSGKKGKKWARRGHSFGSGAAPAAASAPSSLYPASSVPEGRAAVSPAEATTYHQSHISPGASGASGAYTPGSAAETANKRALGFKTDHLVEDKYWDSDTQAWVLDIHVTYGSSSYWDMVHKRGHKTAYDYLSEHDDLTLAIEAAEDGLDSSLGKLNRLNNGDHANTLVLERRRIWIQQDIGEFALQVLQGLAVNDLLDLAAEANQNLDRSS